MQSIKDLKINTLDDLFSTEEKRQYDAAEKIEDIPIEDIRAFKNHPFKVRDDEKMNEMVESIKEHGVLLPTIVRPTEDGKYEMVSGHRRRYACALAGMDTVPAVVRDLTDDQATIIMVDSNIQRENILPSEKAFAYKMKLDAVKHQGKETCRPMVDKLKSADIIGNDTGESGRTVQRYIRLTYLVPKLLEMVDEKVVALRPAVEISYLRESEQNMLLDEMEANDATPSLAQAIDMKKRSQEGLLSGDYIAGVLSQEKPNQKEKITIKKETIRKYFPKSYSDRQMQETILQLLDEWHRKQEKSLSR